jgi:oligopeptide transport system substrate-binding protein
MQRKIYVAGAAAVVGVMALSACGGSSSGGSGSSASSRPLTIYNVKPENPLIPADTNETGGGNIMDAAFRGLVKYNPDTAAPENAMAESITPSKDQKTWDVKLKSGQTFQDGTPVNADSFIDAWNWGAYGPNAAINNTFYAPIVGYDALNPVDPDADGPKKAPAPTAKTLSGLKKVSDTEFTVQVTTPQSYFPTEVGYTAFYPLPQSFYKDPDAFGKKPIGNGPYQIVSGTGDTGFTMKKWAGYKGADQVKVENIQFKTYSDPSAAYADLQAGNLDFMDQVPAAALVDDQYKTDLPGRTLNKPVGLIATLTLPTYDANYNDPNLGKALSLAIDRATITKSVYNGGRTPATGWVSPIVDGYKPGACGTYCTYNPTEAKSYLAKSKFKGPFVLSTNTDGPGNKEAFDAICNSIKNALGVQCTVKAYVDQATSRTDINAHKMQQPFRTAWQMDYPAIQDFLEPLYFTKGSANDGLFSDKTFDALITKADGEQGAAALATYQQAEARLSLSMSVIPLWYYAQQSGWSDRLSNVKVTPFSLLDLTSVTLK